MGRHAVIGERRYATGDSEKRLSSGMDRSGDRERVRPSSRRPLPTRLPMRSLHSMPQRVNARRSAVTNIRPFDPALFRDAAIDADTAKLNADMIELLTGQPEWWIVGAAAMRAARRRGEGTVPGSGHVEPGTDHDHHRQGRQRNPAARDRAGATARDLSASPRRRVGARRRRHAGSDAGADRRQYGSGRRRPGVPFGAGTSLPGGPG